MFLIDIEDLTYEGVIEAAIARKVSSRDTEIWRRDSVKHNGHYNSTHHC